MSPSEGDTVLLSSLAATFIAHGSRPAAGASARAPLARRAAVAACRASIKDRRAPSGGNNYSAAKMAFQVSTYLPMRGGSFQKSSPSA